MERGITSSLNTVLVSGQSVRPTQLAFSTPSVSSTPTLAGQSQSTYFSPISIGAPPGPNVFLTEVTIDGAPPPQVLLPVQQIKPAQLKEQHYSNITSRVPVHNGRQVNTKSLPPVQNLTHLAIASHKRQEKEKLRQKQLQQLQVFNNSFGVATHGLHDSQFTKPKKHLVQIPLRNRDEKSFQKHLADLHAALSAKVDLSTNFGKHIPKIRQQVPTSTNSGEQSVISIRSATSHKSSHSERSRNSHISEISLKSHNSAVEQPKEEPLPAITQRSLQEQQSINQEAQITEEKTSDLDDKRDVEEKESVYSEPISYNSHKTSISVVSGSNRSYSDVTRSGTGSVLSGSYYIGSDADHDRIVQLEENLRNEEAATRKVQKALADIQAKQQALLSKLDPTEREKLKIPLSPRSQRSNRSSKVVSSEEAQQEDENQHKSYYRRRHRHHKEYAHEDAVRVISHHSTQSSPSAQMEIELREKEKEIFRLQGLMTEMATTIARSDPKMMKILKNAVEASGEKKDYRDWNSNTRSGKSIYSNQSSIVFG
jgi:hypothetical protein